MRPSQKEFTERLLAALKEYIAEEESFGDAPQLRIKPESLDVEVIADPDEDLPGYDYYDAVDFLQPTTAGGFTPDPDAIEEVAAEYFEI